MSDLCGGVVKLGSLFTGYGGLDCAVMAHTGAELAWVSEVDPGACVVLAHHHPDVPNLGDITRIDWTQVEPVDVICGGFPCQDISSAGRREGITGDRSGLWTYQAAAVRALRPRLLVVENVAALLVRGLDVVLADLAEMGYDARWGSVRASDAGAPHRRERIFLVAWPADTSRSGWRPVGDAVTSDGGRTGSEPESVRESRGRDRAPADTDEPRSQGNERLARQPRSSGEHTPTDPDSGTGAQHDGGADAVRTTNEGVWGEFWPAIRRWELILGRMAPHPVDDKGRLSPRLTEWMMGLPDGYVTDHVNRTQALRMLGNGVAPQQARLALEMLGVAL